MDYKLERDLRDFCQLYRKNMDETLRKYLQSPLYSQVSEELEEDFHIFQLSLMNRLKEG